MDGEQCKTKILGFGFSILEGVDPNKDNFVCASILHTREAQVGCLMRLEPNTQAQVMYASYFGNIFRNDNEQEFTGILKYILTIVIL